MEIIAIILLVIGIVGILSSEHYGALGGALCWIVAFALILISLDSSTVSKKACVDAGVALFEVIDNSGNTSFRFKTPDEIKPDKAKVELDTK